MLLYQDIITGDEMLSDAFDVYVESPVSPGSHRERAVANPDVWMFRRVSAGLQP